MHNIDNLTMSGLKTAPELEACMDLDDVRRTNACSAANLRPGKGQYLNDGD
jgi:hypothetical protein